MNFKATCKVCSAEYENPSAEKPIPSRCRACLTLKRLGGGQDGRAAPTAVGILNWALKGEKSIDVDRTEPTEEEVQEHVGALCAILTALHNGTPPSLTLEVLRCETNAEALSAARSIRDFLENLGDRADEIIDALIVEPATQKSHS